MKELSIKEKAKAYDLALERAKKWYNAPNIDKMPTYGNRIIEEIFPELIESRDERISREITEFLVDFNNGEYERPNENTIDSWLTWLEKQNLIMAKSPQLGEQKQEENKRNLGGISSNWSEEDEQHIDSLSKRLDGLCRSKFEWTRFSISEDIKWLKSLKSRVVRKEDLIERACEWLRTHSEADYFELIKSYNYCGACNLNKKKMIEDFKKYIKEE